MPVAERHDPTIFHQQVIQNRCEEFRLPGSLHDIPGRSPCDGQEAMKQRLVRGKPC